MGFDDFDSNRSDKVIKSTRIFMGYLHANYEAEWS